MDIGVPNCVCIYEKHQTVGTTTAKMSRYNVLDNRASTYRNAQLTADGKPYMNALRQARRDIQSLAGGQTIAEKRKSAFGCKAVAGVCEYVDLFRPNTEESTSVTRFLRSSTTLHERRHSQNSKEGCAR